MKDSWAVHWAAELALVAHEGQVDKIGAPYINHPRRVAAAVAAEGLGYDVQSVAWLHDVVEDTSVTLDYLLSMGFSAEIVEAVDAISKRKGEKFADYYERVKANPMALAVKWHDIADNTSPERLGKVAPDTRERLQDKYERALTILRAPSTAEEA